MWQDDLLALLALRTQRMATRYPQCYNSMNNESSQMNTPHTAISKSNLHPLIVAAAVAVVLVSGLGAAALMGWLPPSSANQNAQVQLGANGQAVPQAGANGKAVPQVGNSSYRPTAPAHHARQPEPIAAPNPARCAACGVIETVNEVATRGQGTGLGVVGGAVVGGLLGNQVGDGRGRDLATIAGAIGGAVAGNKIEGNVRASHSYTISVRLNDGSMRTFHQSEQPGWHAGDHVRIVNGSIRSDG